MAPVATTSWPLSERMARLLKWGDLEGRYRSRSEMFMALVTAMVGAKWSPDRAWRILTDVHNAGGDPLRTDRNGRPRRKARVYFERAWSNAEEYVTTHPTIRDRGGVKEALVAMRGAADGVRWAGRGGATDRAVLDVLIGIATDAGRFHFHASIRHVAEEIGCNPVTAARSLQRLRKARWITQLSKHTPALAAKYKLKIPAGGTLPQHSGFGEPESYASPYYRGNRSIELAETFCWAGLGWSKHRVWTALSQEPVTARDLASRLGVTTRTVARHLQVLAHHGLAQRALNGWTGGTADPTEVAVRLGTAGRHDQQRVKHALQREQRRAAFGALGVDPVTGELRDATATLGSRHPKGDRSVALTSLPDDKEEVQWLAMLPADVWISLDCDQELDRGSHLGVCKWYGV
jgi:DNA-binding transcriptional regulator YhcF (GntR family)